MAVIDWRFHKEVERLTTDALWITPVHIDDGKYVLKKRDIFKDWNNDFHGLFIPEIPYQFILRFARSSGWIWDCFAGGGTTSYVAKKLHCDERVICNDIIARKEGIIEADSRVFDPTIYTKKELIRLVFFHPPYYNIVKFSDKKEDLCNCSSLEEYLSEVKLVIKNVVKYVEENGYVILVCGNIWYEGEEVDLGVQVKELFREEGFKCRSHIVKDYGETKTKGNTYNLQYYRNLKNDTNFFYGDNIFILKKCIGKGR
ncbi:MAG: hypothetical protein ACTSUO_08415 [Candidatus Thorarchaeota archaeon]